MKIGIRKLYYAAGGGPEYQERVEIWHCYLMVNMVVIKRIKILVNVSDE